jgi:tetratricopeptide (TPR) repeat protein
MKSRRLWAVFAFAALVIGGLATWAINRLTDASPPHKFLVTPDAGLTVGVFVQDSLDFLRPQLLQVAIAEAHLRGGETVAFQARQRRNPFVGPHLQVTVGEEVAGKVDAEFLLRQGDHVLRERYRGSTSGVRYALQPWLSRALSPNPRSPDKSTGYFVSGREAELRFDRERALFDYQRALLREPTLLDAEIAVARLLSDQGRTEEAVATIERLKERVQIGTAQRCGVELLIVRIAPEKLPVPMCPRARMVSDVERLELRAALDEAQRSYQQRFGATEWLERQNAIITSLLRLQEFPQATYEIERAQRFARDAGWTYAETSLLEHRVTMEIHRGDVAKAVALRYRLAHAMETMGDIATALGYRQLAYRQDPPLLGEQVAARRRQLMALIARAREVGTVATEIDAMLQLARLERDEPKAWDARIAQARQRMREASLDAHHTLHPYFLAQELLAQRRYRDTLSEIDQLAEAPLRHPRAGTWEKPQRINALFALDESLQAVREIDAMEASGLNISANPNVCLFSWVLAEAGEDARAQAYLVRCDRVNKDRLARATRGDYGLLAEARLAKAGSQAASVSRSLKSRITELLSVSQPIRQELESLALLSLVAAQLGAIDDSMQREAGEMMAANAKKEGAGPGVRLGAHLLRYQACMKSQSNACGAALPPWAAEDLLWARLAGNSPVEKMPAQYSASSL